MPVVSSALAIDRVVHERMRLAMIAALALNESLGFPDLKELLGATDGNLIVHARRLEDAGYISCTKITDGRARAHHLSPDPGRPRGPATVPRTDGEPCDGPPHTTADGRGQSG